MSCIDCVFRSTYRDMGSSCDVCVLYRNLGDAIHACRYSEGCQYRFTTHEAKIIVKERAGGLPEERPFSRPQKQSGDAAADYATAIQHLKEAGERVAQMLRTEMEKLVKALKKEGDGNER